MPTINKKADGYMGIWYMNTPIDNEYVFKYSGGLGTYCAKHKPFAVYSEEADKTFFVYGGSSKLEDNNVLVSGSSDRDTMPNVLYHMVSYYDHKTKMVPKPTILLDKKTKDAHDNPVISIDNKGYIWIFSTAHGNMRNSFIHKSKKPFDIKEFERIDATWDVDGKIAPFDNFSYFQIWQTALGFEAFFTKYNQHNRETLYIHSKDGQHWTNKTMIASIKEGHYQVSGVADGITATAFNYHPDKKVDGLPGLNLRTNLYYIQTNNHGNSWTNVAGENLDLPLTKVNNPALVKEYETEGQLVYMKDLRFDEHGRPAILYVNSKGYASGPQNGPRIWNIAHWDGKEWLIKTVTKSDNNYDMGSLYIDKNKWTVVGPTEKGPQPYNPGGEMAIWISKDAGKTWKMKKQLTKSSNYNHTYARKPLNTHSDFYSFWADGHGRKPSKSNLYFCDKKGHVFMLPQKMEGDMAKPKRTK